MPRHDPSGQHTRPSDGSGRTWLRPGRSIGALVVALALATAAIARVPVEPPAPDQLYGPLFADVQRAHVFPDQKTFPDCVPIGPPARILADYAAEKDRTGFALKEFVHAHFLVPQVPVLRVPPEPTLAAHLAALWPLLRRSPDRPVPGSSLLPLPHPYVVPGGRFREMYYWDSYFTMLGLRASGREDLIASMVADFASELATYGLIPNGNRTYYLSRSQPPFFALMVRLLAERQGAAVYRTYLPALEAEYAYWMDRTLPTRHVVRLPGGVVLNRYYDRSDTPRPEAFATDEAVARISSEDHAVLYRNIRSAAESGWDFSSRWLADGRSLAAIDTTDVVPVDLNCLLYELERTLAKAWREEAGAPGASMSAGAPSLAGVPRSRAAALARAAAMDAAADRRRAAIRRFCWSGRQGFFVDYDLRAGRRRGELTLAGVVPLFLRVATQPQADAVARTIRERFLRPGGVVTTLRDTGQQWDAPNGWAPLEWMTVRGLMSYGHDALAREIARRWVRLNQQVYDRTGKMMEKYNVEDLSLPGGGGEYPTQDGFGWTNGVWLALQPLLGR